jgi:cob(I)alamin adenosyltransferase
MERYQNDPFPKVSPQMTEQLESWVRTIEAEKITFKGWAMPGETAPSAALDLARAVCRRAERDLCLLEQTGEPVNHALAIYLNRLSDLLWLMGRWIEFKTAPPPSTNLV